MASPYGQWLINSWTICIGTINKQTIKSTMAILAKKIHVIVCNRLLLYIANRTMEFPMTPVKNTKLQATDKGMICAASLESFRPKLYEETEYSKDGEYETSIIFRLIHPRLFSLSLSLFFVIYSVFLQPYNTVCCKSFKLTSIHVTEFLNLHLGWDDQTKKCAEKNNVINLVYVSCIVQISVNIHRNTCSSANNSCFNFHFHFMPILKYLATLGSGASSLSFFLSPRSREDDNIFAETDDNTPPIL